MVAHQRFVDNEAYRAARRGRLIVDKFSSRRRFEGWGAWAQDRIRVRGSRASPEKGYMHAFLSRSDAVCSRDISRGVSFFS